MQLVSVLKGNASEDEFEPVLARKLRNGEVAFACGIGEVEIPVSSGNVRRYPYHVISIQPGDPHEWEINEEQFLPIHSEDHKTLSLRHVLDISPTNLIACIEYTLPKTDHNLSIKRNYYIIQNPFSNNPEMYQLPTGVAPIKFIGDSTFIASIAKDGCRVFADPEVVVPDYVSRVALTLNKGRFDLYLPSKSEIKALRHYDVYTDSSFGPWVGRYAGKEDKSFFRQNGNFAAAVKLADASHVVRTSKDSVTIGDKYVGSEEYENPLAETFFGPAVWGRESDDPAPLFADQRDSYQRIRLKGGFIHDGERYVVAEGLDEESMGRSGRFIKLTSDVRAPEQESVEPISAYCESKRYSERVPTGVFDGTIVVRADDGFELLMVK